MSSLLMWYFLDLPLAHLGILISVVWSVCVSFFLTAQLETRMSLLGDYGFVDLIFGLDRF